MIVCLCPRTVASVQSLVSQLEPEMTKKAAQSNFLQKKAHDYRSTIKQLTVTLVFFYRAMHYSAKRSLAIACRPSVTLVDQDHIGWKSWKLIARTISRTPSLFVAQNPSTFSQGNMGKFGGD